MDKTRGKRGKEIAAAIKGYGHFAAVCIEFVLHGVSDVCQTQAILLTIMLKFKGGGMTVDMWGKLLLLPHILYMIAGLLLSCWGWFVRIR